MVPNCAEGGVLGILPGIVGSIQATEAIKLILGKGEPLIGRLLLYSALEMRFTEVTIKRDSNCPVCGDHPTIRQLIDYEEFCGIRGEGESGQPLESQWETTVEEVKSRLDRGDDFDILDVRTPEEWHLCHIDGAKLIPLGELPARIRELDSSREIVVHCRTSVRSSKARTFLTGAGFRKVKVMRGGITEWAQKVDRSMPTY